MIDRRLFLFRNTPNNAQNPLSFIIQVVYKRISVFIQINATFWKKQIFHDNNILNGALTKTFCGNKIRSAASFIFSEKHFQEFPSTFPCTFDNNEWEISSKKCFVRDISWYLEFSYFEWPSKPAGFFRIFLQLTYKLLGKCIHF